MSQLPSIVVHAAYITLLAPHIGRYADVVPQVDDPYVHLRLADPHGEVVAISLVNPSSKAQWSDEYLADLNRHLGERSAIQKYIIFGKEYGWAKRDLDVYGKVRKLEVKTIFTPNIEEGLAYGLGLIDKGCKHGFYG